MLKKRPHSQNQPFISGHDKYLYLSSQDEYLNKYLSSVDFKKPVHFLSDGRFSLHDLIYFFIKQTGPANVIVSSLSLSNSASILFRRAFDNYRFLSLRIILNAQKRHHSKKGYSNLKTAALIKFADIHDKVACISNEKFKISIVTSSNLTRNQNKEAGVIFFDFDTYDFYYKFLNNVFNQ